VEKTGIGDQFAGLYAPASVGAFMKEIIGKAVGGKARAAKLTQAERSEIARKGGLARWSQGESGCMQNDNKNNKIDNKKPNLAAPQRKDAFPGVAGEDFCSECVEGACPFEKTPPCPAKFGNAG